ncbi:MAG: tetratricopeptide repeat-containing protein, partial [Acidobacteriota bacterium]
MDLTALLEIWRARIPRRWAQSPEIYRQLAARILKLGEPLLAYDVLAEGLQQQTQDLRLRQLLALALARSGATQRANAILNQLLHEGHIDSETLGILARTHKDFALMTNDPIEWQTQLRTAFWFYHRGYQVTQENNGVGDYYTGINAAAMALLLKERAIANKLAMDVRKICLEKLNNNISEDDSYWLPATLGEAAVILGDWAQAEDYYHQAAEQAQAKVADLVATRRQARLLAEFLSGDRQRFDDCFRIPQVVVFAGHMIDQPGRLQPRFPSQLEPAVYQEIAKQLDRLDAGFGYASAACG